MQIGKLALELDQRVIGVCDVAGPAGSGAHAGRGLDHGAYHLGMLAHAKIIVRARDHDVACATGGMPCGARKATGAALEVGEHSVAVLVPQLGQRLREMSLIIHCAHPRKFEPSRSRLMGAGYEAHYSAKNRSTAYAVLPLLDHVCGFDELCMVIAPNTLWLRILAIANKTRHEQ